MARNILGESDSTSNEYISDAESHFHGLSALHISSNLSNDDLSSTRRSTRKTTQSESQFHNTSASRISSNLSNDDLPSTSRSARETIQSQRRQVSFNLSNDDLPRNQAKAVGSKKRKSGMKPKSKTTRVSERLSNLNLNTRTRPYKQQMKLLKEIRTLQERTDFFIPKLAFARCVREIMYAMSSEVTHITKECFQALQTATELYITQVLSDAYALTLHRNRVTLSVVDMKLLQYLRSQMS